MVTHIVLWNLLDSLSDEDKKLAASEMKEKLEGLKDKIEGIQSIHLYINEIESSNRDLALIVKLDTKEHLAAYITHPEHKKVGAEYVRPFTQDRACLDFEE